MKLQIKSGKLNKTLTFTRPGFGHVFVDLNGRDGDQGNMLCKGGLIVGSPLTFYGNDENEFKRLCRNWYRSHVR